MTKKAKPQKPQPKQFVTNPFKEPTKLEPAGDDNILQVWEKVGEAMSVWEECESAFSKLFCTIIRPDPGPVIPIARAYGAVISQQLRKKMIEAAAEGFFLYYPNTDLRLHLSQLLTAYMDAGGRRNELAHGVVYGIDDRKGNYVIANYYGLKRKDVGLSPYHYTRNQIHTLINNYGALTSAAYRLCDLLKNEYESSPDRFRRRRPPRP